MTERRPVDRALDLVVFAPLGLALSVPDVVAALAEKGRRRLASQVTTARLIGELAVGQGTRSAAGALARARRHAGQAVAGARRASPPAPNRVPIPVPDRPPTLVADGAGGGDSGPEAGELAIPGYDTLSAFQVVQRLEGLSADELEAVRAYEQAGRGRKTVLTRIAQLRVAS